MAQIISNKDIKLLWMLKEALEQLKVLFWHDLSHLEGKKLKNLAQENNEVCLFEEMTNASALSEKKPPLRCDWKELSNSRTRLKVFISNLNIALTVRYKLKVAFIQKGLMRLSFLQTGKPHYFPELKIWFFFLLNGSNHVKKGL